MLQSFTKKSIESNLDKDATQEIASTKNQGKSTNQKTARKTKEKLETQAITITVQKGCGRASEIAGGIALLLATVNTFEKINMRALKFEKNSTTRLVVMAVTKMIANEMLPRYPEHDLPINIRPVPVYNLQLRQYVFTSVGGVSVPPSIPPPSNSREPNFIPREQPVNALSTQPQISQ